MPELYTIIIMSVAALCWVWIGIDLLRSFYRWRNRRRLDREF